MPPAPFIGGCLGLLLAGCTQPQIFSPDASQAPDSAWIQLFNGRNLDGWQAKFVGLPLGDNFADTFRVENGLLRVVYDERYDTFGQRFGHLFFEAPFDYYRLRVEYRFVGDQVAGGPGWAQRNNGLMLHGQDPASMALDQEFPVSIEAQLLGATTGERTTGNLCTPGTHVEMGGELVQSHCTHSTSPTYPGDQWVIFEAEVLGSGSIRHFINGELVLEYGAPQLDPTDSDAQRLLAAGAESRLSSGSISIQAESHPTDFRKIELMPLDKYGAPISPPGAQPNR